MNIRQEVQQELSRGNGDKEIINLALAAFDGDEAVERALAGEIVETSEVVPDDKGQVSPVYLQDITVSGFRGIGPEARLKIPPGPGLTVVVGRNGSGKSSFSEALEVLLTEVSYRWKGKAKVWKDGWENLHRRDNTEIVARFQVEGMSEQTVVQRIWHKGSELEESEFLIQHNGQSYSNLDEIGWKSPLEIYRPILSYNELNMREDGPSGLYDKISGILGLEELVYVRKNLSAARNRRERYKKEVNQDLKDTVIPTLAGSDDERAIKAKEALTKRPWDLNVIISIITDFDFESDVDYKVLQDIKNLEVPDEEQVKKVAEEIDLAYTNLSNKTSAEIKRAEYVMQLLETALKHYELYHKNQICPVCGVGRLDDSWHTRTLEQIKQLKDMTQGYQEAKEDLDFALDEARKLVTVRDFPVSDMVDTEELLSVWNQWGLLPDNEDKVSEHLLSQYSVVRDKLSKVFEQASQRFSEREEQLKPIFNILREWAHKAKKVDKERPEIRQISDTEDAVKIVIDNIQSRLLEDIESHFLNLWDNLRLQSNITLRSIKLVGSSTDKQRKVDLEAVVDDIDTDALSVASQGELSCLALSLFFPRVMLPASPFRFIVIDDPVQAMDPARVDGLARVFAEIAKDRQLIVFTHDDRLPKFLRLLNLEHHCLEVTREPNSVVKVDKKRNPVIQYFRDAQLVMGNKKIPLEIKILVIPGLCRSGLEAACAEAIWRRWLYKKGHEAIEKELLKAHTLNEKASLVLYNKRNKGDKVRDRISDKWGRELADAYYNTDEGVHSEYSGDLSELIKNCKSLAKKLRHYKV